MVSPRGSWLENGMRRNKGNQALVNRAEPLENLSKAVSGPMFKKHFRL